MSSPLIDGLWDDCRFLLTAKPIGPNNPSLTVFMGGIKLWQYSSSNLNELDCVAQLPHAYREGSDLRLHLHWCHNGATDNGAVVWQVEYQWANVGDVFPAPTTVASAPLNVLAADRYRHQIATIATLSGAGKKVSSIINARIFRDPGHVSDTATGDTIFLLDGDSHFQQDACGSIGDFSKP